MTMRRPAPRMNVCYSKRGFTLIEMMVVIAVTVLVMGALSMLIVYFYKTNAFTLQQSIASEQGRRGV